MSVTLSPNKGKRAEDDALLFAITRKAPSRSATKPPATITAAQYRAQAKARKPNKYRNKPMIADGEQFDSRREYARYAELQGLERAGKIWGLERQPEFILAPTVRLEGEKRAKPALKYKADFSYWMVGPRQVLGARVVEDVKSAPTAKTAAFRIKRHLMKSVHGIEIRIVK